MRSWFRAVTYLHRWLAYLLMRTPDCILPVLVFVELFMTPVTWPVLFYDLRNSLCIRLLIDSSALMPLGIFCLGA